jgi:hypothetical protein
LAKRAARFPFCASAHSIALGGRRERNRTAPVNAGFSEFSAQPFFDFEFAEKRGANFRGALKI